MQYYVSTQKRTRIRAIALHSSPIEAASFFAHHLLVRGTVRVCENRQIQRGRVGDPAQI